MESRRVKRNQRNQQRRSPQLQNQHEPQEDVLIYPKFIRKIFIASMMVFFAAWLIPKLPWRPKRIEDYLTIYRMIFEAFRTWSMVSTAFTTFVIFSYFMITGAYNWRRQYAQSTRNEKAEQFEDVSENERLWEEIRTHKIEKAKTRTFKRIENEAEMVQFMESIKVFEYLEEGALKQTLKTAVLKDIHKGEILSLKRTDLVFVTFGSFKTTFIDPSSKVNELTVTCTRGKTLTSYSNVMRAFAHYYNNAHQQRSKEEKLTSIKAVAQENSQILILNEECFVKLAKISKLSVAHLTQVILSRFKRATIPIIFDYFNLTGFAASFLGYFVKKSQGFNDTKLTDLLNAYQETIKSEEKLLRVILQYLIGSFELDHTVFAPMESSLALLQSHIQIFSASTGTIQEIGEECQGAFLVLEGKLRVSFSKDSGDVVEVSVGDFVGVISCLMGKCSSIQVQCVTSNRSNTANKNNNNVTYAVISQHLLEMISERDPKILFANMPDNRHTSQFIEFLDMCIDWQQLSCGDFIDGCDVIVKVLHGRVREFTDLRQRELGSGSFLGESEIFKTESSAKGLECPCFFTVRQTEIATFPVDLIEELVTANSHVAKSLLPKLLSRSSGNIEDANNDVGLNSNGGVDPIKTICLLPVGVDYNNRNGTSAALIRDNQTRLTEAVSEGLQRTLKRHQTTFTVIDGARAAELMGRQLFTTLGTLKMNEFLSEQEDVTKMIIYVADGIFSNWTRQCISQADLVLLVADLDSEEVIQFGDLERQMLQMNPLINVELCLISGKWNNRERSDSRRWLKNRPWIKAHYHLAVPFALLHHEESAERVHGVGRRHINAFDPNVLNMIPSDLFNNLIRKSKDLLRPRNLIYGSERRGSLGMLPVSDYEDEIEVLGYGRLCRRILGRSLGLVLGGGGARGLAHLGIFKAFKEAGIQVDIIGGTSMGAFIGGLLAKEGLGNYPRVYQFVGQFCNAMSSKWRQALDLTYPATSWFTGHGFNRALWKLFGFSGIEDFSIPFFAVTTDLTRSGLQVHRTGPAWKYIRASMSLSGFLPPVCDARDGTLLVDGGYLANVPIELMQKGILTELSELTVKDEQGDERRREALSAALVIAVDVGRASDRVPIFYGDTLNGWWVLIQKFADKLMWKKSSNINSGRTSVSSDISKANSQVIAVTSDIPQSHAPLPLTLDEIQFRLAYASSAGLLSRTLKRSHFQLASDLKDKKELAYVTVTQGRADTDYTELLEDGVSDSQSDSQSQVDIPSTCALPEVIYLRPGGIQQYGTLEFQKWKDIVSIGYEYGRSVLEEWKRTGLLDKILEFQGHCKQPSEREIDRLQTKKSFINNNSIRYRRSSI